MRETYKKKYWKKKKKKNERKKKKIDGKEMKNIKKKSIYIYIYTQYFSSSMPRARVCVVVLRFLVFICLHVNSASFVFENINKEFCSWHMIYWNVFWCTRVCIQSLGSIAAPWPLFLNTANAILVPAARKKLASNFFFRSAVNGNQVLMRVQKSTQYW